MNVKKHNICRVNEYQIAADGAISIDGAEGKAGEGKISSGEADFDETCTQVKNRKARNISTLPETYLTCGINGNHIAHRY